MSTPTLWNSDLLTVDDVSQLLAVKKQTAYRLMREMNCVRIGGKILRVTKRDLIDWLENHKDRVNK